MASAPPTASELDSFLKGVSNTQYTQVSDRRGTKFPAKLSHPDPEDAKWNLRKEAITDGGKTPAGMAIAPDSFFDYIDRKKQNELLADYEAWVMENADLSKPETIDWWYRTVPWIRNKRLSVIEEQAELQKNIARIQVDGPKSEEDLKLIFAIKNGLINISNKPLYQLGADGDKALSNSFRAGLFNPYSSFFITGADTTGINATKVMSKTNQGTQFEQFAYTDPFFGATKGFNTTIGGFRDKFDPKNI